MVKEKYRICDEDGNRYGKTFDTYEDAEWYMKEHQNVGLIPEGCDVEEYCDKAEYTLDKLWLLDMIVDNMNSSSIIIAETREQAKELLRVKMELEPDVDIEKWFHSNGIKFLLQKAKEVDDVWSEKFPNVLAIT